MTLLNSAPSSVLRPVAENANYGAIWIHLFKYSQMRLFPQPLDVGVVLVEDPGEFDVKKA